MLQSLTVLTPILASMILGAMLFFSAVIAPVTFTKIPIEHAGALIRAVFPWYYVVLGSIAALTVLVAPTVTQKALLGLVAAGLLGARFIAIPVINAARDAGQGGDAQAQARFDTWHQATVVLNGLEIVALIAVLVLYFRAQ